MILLPSSEVGPGRKKTEPCIYYCPVSYDKMCADVRASLIESKQTSGRAGKHANLRERLTSCDRNGRHQWTSSKNPQSPSHTNTHPNMHAHKRSFVQLVSCLAVEGPKGQSTKRKTQRRKTRAESPLCACVCARVHCEPIVSSLSVLRLPGLNGSLALSFKMSLEASAE